MEKLIKQLNVIEFDTEEALGNDVIFEYNKDTHIQEQLEEEYPDISFTGDVNLESLLEGLNYNGITNDQIKTMNNAQYGNVIDIYKIKDDTFYILGIGAR